MSVAKDVKDLIFAKIDALPTVQVTYKHEELDPTGYPAVCITATGMDGEFYSNSQNRRIYSYRVFVHMPIGQDLIGADTNRLDYADNVVTEVIDQIIGTIDDDFTLDDAIVLFVNAADSEYQYTQLNNGWARTAICTLQVNTDYELPNSAFILDEQGQPILEE